jgi:hypothetical protein
MNSIKKKEGAASALCAACRVEASAIWKRVRSAVGSSNLMELARLDIKEFWFTEKVEHG